MNLKKLGSYLRVNLLGPGPRLTKKKIIYRAAVSQRLRNTSMYLHIQNAHSKLERVSLGIATAGCFIKFRERIRFYKCIQHVGKKLNSPRRFARVLVNATLDSNISLQDMFLLFKSQWLVNVPVSLKMINILRSAHPVHLCVLCGSLN